MKNDLLNDRYFKSDLLTLFMMCLSGAAHGWAPKICHTYPTKMKLDSYTLPKEDPKKNLTFSSADIRFFSLEIN